jgi:hypothetical protein
VTRCCCLDVNHGHTTSSLASFPTALQQRHQEILNNVRSTHHHHHHHYHHVPNSNNNDIIITWCIYAVRFWSRSWVQQLAFNQFGDTYDFMFPVNTIFAMSHFGKPTIDYHWKFANPKVPFFITNEKMKHEMLYSLFL